MHIGALSFCARAILTSAGAARMMEYKRVRSLCWINMSGRFTLLFFLLTSLSAPPAFAYDYPLSPNAIRDAYFLGRRQPSLGDKFLSEYTQAIPELKAGPFFSEARIETPFFHIAEYASRKLEYNAQNAVEDFLNKPAVFRIHLDICYRTDAAPNAIKITVLQNKKELLPEAYESSSYYPATDKYARMPSIGEHIQLELNPGKIDSTILTIAIDTPDGQHAKAEFDLQLLR
jgi:hypothetical protein